MTADAKLRRRSFPNPTWLLLPAPLLAYLVVQATRTAALARDWRPPDWGLLVRAAPVIQLHVAGAVVAFVIGVVLLAGVKGARLHRTLGWTWVLAMGTTAVSSLFIHHINPGGFSLIHLLSGWTLIALPMAVFAARRHRVKAHRRGMTAMFVGGLLIAGVFAFVPGRLMWAVFFG